MVSFRSDPYFWIHLAGAAAVPLFLELTWVGLSVGDPLFSGGLELLLVAAVGLLPLLWMQWTRPFYIFSLLFVAIAPQYLSEEQRRILSLFLRTRNRWLALLVPVGLVAILWNLYLWSPVAAGIAAYLPQSHFLGLAIAAGGFFGANLFLQVPVSVLAVLLTPEPTFAATSPVPVDQLTRIFTIPGWKVQKILPLPPISVELASPQPISDPIPPPVDPPVPPENLEP
ncbi:low-complexity tail membrane protein [Laspinema sp. A4]|uniref:low-complexity tail membrane protein n=1 Tax=Laspinema sp. D2d TaxID=2953686 RepID=UPI0021BA6373|nr:low-complexity tail membrane protein [Laspinema sp. D2d]MCT7984213.1 low-complexity tail membrane protein [Laspinema sp. D2d]